jgi:hypothetical protein
MDSPGGPNDDLDGVASTSSAQSSPRQLSLRAESRDTSQHGVELDAQSLSDRVSPRIQVRVVNPRHSLDFFPSHSLPISIASRLEQLQERDCH